MTIQTMWGWEPAIYLFLGGLAGGTFFISALVRLATKDRFQRLSVVAPWVSFAALAVGLFCLVIEVEKPLQAMMMWRSFVNFSSWMTIGAWLLFASIAVFFLSAFFSTPRLVKALKVKEGVAAKVSQVTMVLGAVLGLGVAAYTGVLLMAAGSVPLWNTPLIPVLFTVSALDAGAVVVLACLLGEKAEGADAMYRKVSLASIALIVGEALVLTALLMSHLSGSVSQAIAASTLVSGDLSLQFWLIVVIVGLAIPLVLDLLTTTKAVKNKDARRVAHIAVIVLVLVGGLALRYVILAAGIHAVSVSPDVAQAIQDVYALVL